MKKTKNTDEVLIFYVIGNISRAKERSGRSILSPNGHAVSKEIRMSKKLIASEMNPSEIYPDPLGRAKGSAVTGPMADIALAGDIPASRLFSNLPAALARDIRGEVKREWEEEHSPSAKG